VDELPQLITFAEIEAKTLTLAEAIRRDYGDEPLLLVGVLKGSLFFLASLALKLGREVAIDFVSVSSYGDDTVSSGVVQIRKDLDINIEGRNVLLVEDIVDTGATLVHLRELLLTRHPKSLKSSACSLSWRQRGSTYPSIRRIRNRRPVCGRIWFRSRRALSQSALRCRFARRAHFRLSIPSWVASLDYLPRYENIP